MLATSSLSVFLVSAVLGQAAEPAPLTDSQRASIAALARNSQAESARLKQSLAERQRELADRYTRYQLDHDEITRLEREIVALQTELLASYRKMQLELRKLVPEDRFMQLKRRLDHALESQQPAARNRGAEIPAETETAARPEAERVYSGPQVGEDLTPFMVRGVFDADAGKEIDFITEADGKPIVLVFVHDVNRPAIALTRTLTSYTAGRAADGLTTGIVWLDADATEAENALKRMRHALAAEARVGISPDGVEGPGSYGLNRNVTLTVLVGKAGKVTANFAIVQPSLQADLPRILDEVVRVAGGTAPRIEELVGERAMKRDAGSFDSDQLRELLRPVIQLAATEEEVDRAAEAVEKFAAENESARREVGRIANTIIDAGKLSNYGTPRAQHYLTKWADEYGPSKAPPAGERNP